MLLMKAYVIMVLSWGLCPLPVVMGQSITVLGNPTMAINTPALYQNGATITHTTLRVTVPRRFTWDLRLSAAGNLTSGVNTIPIGAMSVLVTNTDVTTYPITLSTTQQLLCSDYVAKQSDRNSSLTIQYTLQGGNHLLKPAGSYATTLTFFLTVQ